MSSLRPPPRGPPFTDYDELVEELSGQFHVVALDGSEKRPPEKAKSDWTASELQMWFASGGMIEPAENPKMRAMAAKLAASQDIRSPAEVEAEQRVKALQEAARKASWFSLLTAQDIAKSDLYREVVLAYGHPQREVGNLYSADDELLRAHLKTKHHFPFEKHILFWDDEASSRKVVHPPEGATHGPSAALRGMDQRLFWDASSLKVVGCVRYSLAAVVGWAAADNDDSWSLDMIHGGMIEMCLDDLTAEVMKINMAPQCITAELTVKLKKQVLPNVTYKVSARLITPAPEIVVGPCTLHVCLTAVHACTRASSVAQVEAEIICMRMCMCMRLAGRGGDHRVQSAEMHRGRQDHDLRRRDRRPVHGKDGDDGPHDRR